MFLSVLCYFFLSFLCLYLIVCCMYVYLFLLFGDLFEFWLTHAAQLWPLFDLICCEIINSRVVVLLINCFPDFAPTMPLICVSWLASWYINHPNKHFKYYERALIAIFLNNVFVVVLVWVLDFVSVRNFPLVDLYFIFEKSSLKNQVWKIKFDKMNF